MIKSANKGGAWSVAARLTGGNGAPLSELIQSSEPQVSSKAPLEEASGHGGEQLPQGAELSAGGELPPAVQGPPGALPARARGAARGRCQARGARGAAFRRGLAGQPFRALFFLARASNANDEQGRALDVLNDGVKRFGDQLPEFYAERARVYLEKGLFEKAQADAEAFLRLRPHDLRGQS